MTHNTLPTRETQTPRTEVLRHMVNHLIELAPHSEELGVQEKVDQIVESMKLEMLSPSDQLRQLEELAQLSTIDPDELVRPSDKGPEELIILEALDDTAELILEELGGIESARPKVMKSVENINSVWSAIRAWDVARSGPTAALCAKLLKNFRGAGQATLDKAYMQARDRGIRFNTALDEINAAT